MLQGIIAADEAFITVEAEFDCQTFAIAGLLTQVARMASNFVVDFDP